MQGGVILFRGSGADARRYVESDRSRADDYYLGREATIARFTALDGAGRVTAAAGLGPDAYARWVDWLDPLTGESMGTPRPPREGRRGSPRFAEMVVNAPKSLSIAAALHPEVSEALDIAEQDAVAEIQRFLAGHSVTRVGPRGRQEVVPVEVLQTVAVTHRTSRAGDPHRHIHLQIGTRVRAAGAWRGLDTAALFKQQGAIRALGTAVIAAHPQLAEILDRHGLTLDPATGEVAELQPFNAVMSKRADQVTRHLGRLEAEWEAAHPGEVPGPVVSARLQAAAWAQERPAKKPTTLREEQAWRAELRQAGYDPAALRRPERRAPVSPDELSVQAVANRALDRCEAGASTWTRHTIQEHATRVMTGYGVRAAPGEIRDFVEVATRLALEDCFSVLPPGAPAPEHVAHLTSVRVVQAELQLRELLAARVAERATPPPQAQDRAALRGLDAGQARAAVAVASTDPLVVVEGAAGAGKTTMLGAAIAIARRYGRVARVVAPTLRAAQAAHDELGTPADSVAALVHAHGWRWNEDGVWTRLAPGDSDPDRGGVYAGPPEAARLVPGERVIVDEAGMLDQDTAIALLTVCAEAGATVALVGDRAQLPAVGRGGVLDMVVQLLGHAVDMAEVHRFADPEYARVTLRMREGTAPAEVFDRLAALGLVRLHASSEELRGALAREPRGAGAITAATDEEARAVNAVVREARVSRGEVDDVRTVAGRDGLPIGAGDVIQTRRNDPKVGVANRQNWVVQRVEDDGALRVREVSGGRKRQRTVTLPAEYVAEHTHLVYAATAYGVQGVTAARSHTILTDTSSAAAVYVGMTRGRDENLLHLVAEDLADAKEQFAAAMERDRADRGLDDATRRAAGAVTGLAADGPVRQVDERVAALTKYATDAARRAAQWAQVPQLAEARRWARAAQAARTEIDVLRDLPLEQAAARIRAQKAVAARAAQLRDRQQLRQAPALPQHAAERRGPTLGL